MEQQFRFEERPDDKEEVIATRFVDRKVCLTGSRARKVFTGRRLSTAIDAIANYPHPALFDVVVLSVFLKDSTSRGGGAKGVDVPKEGTFVCLKSYGFGFSASIPAFFTSD